MAQAALCLTAPEAKAQATLALWQQWDCLDKAQARAWIAPGETIEAPPGLPLPGRPDRPLLIAPGSVPTRSPFTAEGFAALIHAICHIEFNAVNLALDAIWRFPGLPEAYYTDWLKVAQEEARHFGLLHALLNSLGHAYGDFAAHDGLWEMCIKTQHDVTARMALVPRTLEARGLDATPLIQARLRKVNTVPSRRAVEILDILLHDEIGHVAVGNRWYAWLCERDRLDPLLHYRVLARRHQAPRLRPPFNAVARRQAGFSAQEIADLGAAPG